MENRKIRHYEAGDAQTIVKIYNSAFGKYLPFFPRTEESWVWRYANRPDFDPESVLFVEEEGKAVSSLVITYAKMMISGILRKVALIDDVATLPDFQRRGHSSDLVKRAIEIASEKECYAVHLVANPKGSAIRIYEKLGFKSITDLKLMESILRPYDLSKAVGYRYYFPMLFLNSWMRLREKKRNGFAIEMVFGRDLTRTILACQENYPRERNGFIEMDEDYIDWMTKQRPVGKLIGLTASIEDELVGMLTISVHTLESRRIPFQAGNIGNLLISEQFWTQKVLSEFLQTARLVAKDTLGCILASIAVDTKDTILNDACKESRFYPLSQAVAMIHPLENEERIHAFKNILWAQPLETVFADP
jgi:ribosomal protein S18 acetylase RimI-like enzyme